ncbi:hypothetical protein ACNF40_08730 [Cuniculiplasma sp. SKW4]|uniref:hypothetical protein n=1 Tax=Cuniculiplasma sp. SKW4 TaxID=3400171 RepID=UPI003FD07671
MKSVNTVTKNVKITQKPLTSRDREQYVHRFRENQGRISWTVRKASFGQNDILGCVDTISYTPSRIIFDQTSTVHHIPDKRKEYQRMLQNSPTHPGIMVCIHGVEGYRKKIDGKWIPVITRHVIETWLPDSSWKREEVLQGEFIDPMECIYLTKNTDAVKPISKSIENKKKRKTEVRDAVQR